MSPKSPPVPSDGATLRTSLQLSDFCKDSSPNQPHSKGPGLRIPTYPLIFHFLFYLFTHLWVAKPVLPFELGTILGARWTVGEPEMQCWFSSATSSHPTGHHHGGQAAGSYNVEWADPKGQGTARVPGCSVQRSQAAGEGAGTEERKPRHICPQE